MANTPAEYNTTPNASTATTPIMDDNTNSEAVNKVYEAINNLSSDISRRNIKIDKRYRYVYEDGLYDETNIKSGFDRTRFNLLRRVLEIHASQVMGRAFQVKSSYDKIDLSVYNIPGGDPDQQKKEKDQAIQLNGRRAADADVRVRAIKDMVKDNGGYDLFTRAAHIAEWAGFVVFKCWADPETKTYKIVALETPQNCGASWSNSNFREADFYYYNYQISESKANRLYLSKLPSGATFNISTPGGKVGQSVQGEDLERMGRKMVWVTDITGYIDGFKGDNGKLVACKPGDESKVSVLIVGGHVVQVITKENLLPKYYTINNLEVPQEPWGESGISEELMQINGTLIQTVSDWTTHNWKTLFPKLMGKGYTALNVPKFLEREAQFIPADQDQDIHEIAITSSEAQYEHYLGFLMDQFVKHARVSRVMLDDPSVNNTSDRALMTAMKPMLDVTRDKQTRWGKTLVEMFTDALEAVKDWNPALKEAVDDSNWFLTCIWPSVLQREDQAYQTMYQNRIIGGTISVPSYLEAMGAEDVQEELDRIRDDMEDPIRASILGRSMAHLAGYTVNKSLGIPPWGYVLPHVQLRGELPPQEVGNMGHNYGWDQGPYGATIGPTGMDGQIAADNYLNAGLTNGNVRDGGTANYPGPPATAPGAGGAPTGAPGAPGPNEAAHNLPGVMTPPGGAGPQPMSQTGSGATPTSPAGAVKQRNQRGK